MNERIAARVMTPVGSRYPAKAERAAPAGKRVSVRFHDLSIADGLPPRTQTQPIERHSAGGPWLRGHRPSGCRLLYRGADRAEAKRIHRKNRGALLVGSEF
jgi:hypothetical protein